MVSSINFRLVRPLHLQWWVLSCNSLSFVDVTAVKPILQQPPGELCVSSGNKLAMSSGWRQVACNSRTPQKAPLLIFPFIPLVFSAVFTRAWCLISSYLPSLNKSSTLLSTLPISPFTLTDLNHGETAINIFISALWLPISQTSSALFITTAGFPFET